MLFYLTPAGSASFPSPARLERGGFGNEAGVREKHGASPVGLTPLHCVKTNRWEIGLFVNGLMG
jgi:hypothetical protein